MFPTCILWHCHIKEIARSSYCRHRSSSFKSNLGWRNNPTSNSQSLCLNLLIGNPVMAVLNLVNPIFCERIWIILFLQLRLYWLLVLILNQLWQQRAQLGLPPPLHQPNKPPTPHPFIVGCTSQKTLLSYNILTQARSYITMSILFMFTQKNRIVSLRNIFLESLDTAAGCKHEYKIRWSWWMFQ